jgi:Dyp-type peroxidase family
MAAQNLVLESARVQPHTVTAAHRGLAVFLFVRFLSEAEKANPTKVAIPALDADGLDDGPGSVAALIEFALRDSAGEGNGKRAAKAQPGEGASVALKALDLMKRTNPRGAKNAKGEPAGLAPLLQTLNGFEWQSTLSFTYSGLAALGVHAGTLKTFPEAFQQGMAARASLLGDTGASAPDKWQGALGDRRVHALLMLSSPQLVTNDVATRATLRAYVREFNTGLDDEGKPSTLRATLKAVTTDLAGIEILHVELGEDPFEEKNGKVQDFDRRLEHFGWRDGVSQPFVLTDMQTGALPSAPPPGGGRPMPDGSWAPLATGELFLGFPDEDGLVAVEPANKQLRDGGTYLVFRKLEQDVAGFHSFFAARRKDPNDRWRLAAHMMGRWPNGVSVVRSPDYQPATIEDDAATINDFRYEAEDPHGQKCPIGAHARRVNPRDYLHGEAARRHRLLRRGISYGGSLIPPGAAGDGEPRGLLFVAINARIDLQFEFIQRDWLNSGEQFGRVGAGRCPITGTLDGKCTDAFHEGGRIAPETHLPRFVTTRGGEYFFAPSVDALKALQAGGKDLFKPEQTPMAYRPGEGSVRPGPEFLSKDRLRGYAQQILATPQSVKRLTLTMPGQTGSTQRNVAFLGRYSDVAHAQTNPKVFTEKHYLDIGRQLTGDDVIIGLPDGDADRQARTQLLWQAYQDLAGGNLAQLHQEMAQFVATKSLEVLARVGPMGRMDLLQDLGFYVPFLFAQRFFGVVAPNWLTPVAIAAKYGRTNAAETPKQWLVRAPEVPPPLASYLTMQTWTRFCFAEVFTNIMRRSDLSGMARQAAVELQQQIDMLISRERMQPSGANNLLAKLVKNWSGGPAMEAQNFRRTRMALTDLLGALTVNAGSPFARVMELILDQSVDMASILGAHGGTTDAQLNQFIEEALRLNPAGAIQFRTVKADPDNPNWSQLPSGGTVQDGDLVVLMVFSANIDPRVFGPRSTEFSLARDPNVYLTFGGPKNAAAPHPGGDKDASPNRTALHHCWGEHIGLLLIREMLRATAQLPLLRRAAGPAGDTALNLNLPYSLGVRFSPIGA